MPCLLLVFGADNLDSGKLFCGMIRVAMLPWMAMHLHGVCWLMILSRRVSQSAFYGSMSITAHKEQKGARD